MSEHLTKLIRDRLHALREARANTEGARLRHTAHAEACAKDVARYDVELNQLLDDLERITGPSDKIAMKP